MSLRGGVPETAPLFPSLSKGVTNTIHITDIGWQSERHGHSSPNEFLVHEHLAARPFGPHIGEEAIVTVPAFHVLFQPNFFPQNKIFVLQRGDPSEFLFSTGGMVQLRRVDEKVTNFLAFSVLGGDDNGVSVDDLRNTTERGISPAEKMNDRDEKCEEEG
jgi:hypothetical protein